MTNLQFIIKKDEEKKKKVYEKESRKIIREEKKRAKEETLTKPFKKNQKTNHYDDELEVDDVRDLCEVDPITKEELENLVVNDWVVIP